MARRNPLSFLVPDESTNTSKEEEDYQAYKEQDDAGESASEEAADTLSQAERGEENVGGDILRMDSDREEPLEKRLESATNLLLSQLTPNIVLFAEEIADIVLKIPRWQLVCGSVLAQFESGTLTAPALDPAWTHGGPFQAERACERCHEIFLPFKPFQKYCSNACGTATLLSIREARKERRIVVEAATSIS